MSTLKVETMQVNTLEEYSAGGATFFITKAWINFKGTSTITIRDDGNFSSLTDHGTGEYTATYTNAFSNNNYSPVVTCKERDDTGNTTVVPHIGPNQSIVNSIKTTSIRIGTRSGNSRYDSAVVSIHVTN